MFGIDTNPENATVILKMNSEILIVGKGIAGMTSAIYLAELRTDIQITLIDKSDGSSSATFFAQGGLAAVQSTLDSFDSHYNDTLEAGHFLNDPKIVREVVTRAPEVIQDLSSWGVSWDRFEDGRLNLGLEGGHSFSRIVHHGDQSGKIIHQLVASKLRNYPNIQLIEHIAVRDLWVEEGECKGVIVFQEDLSQEMTIPCQTVILATGGLSSIFPRSTNAQNSTGDGLAIALRTGVKTEDLPWVQFHPTALNIGRTDRPNLLTEALRGAGAYIINEEGSRFLFNSLTKGELSTRDLVCQAIWREIAKDPNSNVYLDCRHFPKGAIKKSFPQVYSLCQRANLDPEKDLLPIVPAAHYHCGGISTDRTGKTSLPRLYAVGEVARTGLHGCNRLASNSIIEALVFAKNAAVALALEHSKESAKSHLLNTRKIYAPNISGQPSIIDFWKESLFEYFMKKSKPEFDSIQEIRDRLQILELSVKRGIYSTAVLRERNLLQIYETLLISSKNEYANDFPYQKNRI